MSIFEQPDIRSNTKTGMMRKINLTLTGVLAVLAFAFTLGAGPIHAQVRTVVRPACPIKTTMIPQGTKTPFTLPNENLQGDGISVTGIVQVTDQSGGTVSETQYDAMVDDTGVTWNRTMKSIAHETGSLSFDKGCKASDQYGSNNCHWDWGQNVTASYGWQLQEDITSGKFIGDLMVIQSAPGLPDKTTNVQFTCPVCGGTCTIPVPEQPTITIPKPLGQNTPDEGKVWDFMTFPLFLATPLPIFRLLIGGFANAH